MVGHSDAEYVTQIAEIESRYAIVIEENENLRVGMHEILEQLRNYDGKIEAFSVYFRK